MSVIRQPAISEYSSVHGTLISFTRPHEKRIVIIYGTFDGPRRQDGETTATICRRAKADLSRLAGNRPVALHVWGDYSLGGTFVGELSVICFGMDVADLDHRFRGGGYELGLCCIFHLQQEAGDLIAFRARHILLDAEQRHMLRVRRREAVPEADAYRSVLNAERRFSALIATYNNAEIYSGVGLLSHQVFKYFVFFEAGGELRAAYYRDVGRVMNLDTLKAGIPAGYEEQYLRFHRWRVSVEAKKENLRDIAARDLGWIHNAAAASSVCHLLTKIRFCRDWFVHCHYRNTRFEWAFVHHYDLHIIRWRREMNDVVVNDLHAHPVE
eukprot:scaffold55065_cov40-Cyclotella_meneghiniana.AAC.2